MSLAQIHALDAAVARQAATEGLLALDIGYAATVAAFVGKDGIRPMQEVERKLKRITNG